MKTKGIALLCVAFMLSAVWAQESGSAIERYRDLEFPATPETAEIGFAAMDKGWKDRVSLEFEIVNNADLESLRAGLTTPVTSIASGTAPQRRRSTLSTTRARSDINGWARSVSRQSMGP